MSAPADKVARVPSRSVLPFTSPTLVRFASIAFCGVLPALVLISVFAAAVGDDSVAFDFRVFLSAAHAVLHGDSPYPSVAASDELIGRSYVYPPLTALVSVPFTVLPVEAAGLIVMALLAAAALAVPWVIGVRDWRCYGVLLRWPPVISGIQTGSVTLAIALLAAVGWRFRDSSALASSTAIGVTLAAKIFLWPLVVWLAATRRVGSAVSALAIGIGLFLHRGRRSASLASWTTRHSCGGCRTRRGLTRIPPTSWDSISAYPQRLLARSGWPSDSRRSPAWSLWHDAGTSRPPSRRNRGVARAHSDRVAPLLRPSPRGRRACAAVTRGHLVRFVPDGRHAGERSSDAVPDRMDVGRRSRHRRAGCARVARRLGARPRPGGGESVTTSSVAEVKGPARVDAATWVRERGWALTVWVAMTGWSLCLFWIVRHSYVSFREGRFDLGNMVQAVWSTAHGHPLEVTLGPTGDQIVRLGGHVDPFLALLTPLWLLWPSPLALGFAQVLLVALGALPVFWLGRREVVAFEGHALPSAETGDRSRCADRSRDALHTFEAELHAGGVEGRHVDEQAEHGQPSHVVERQERQGGRQENVPGGVGTRCCPRRRRRCSSSRPRRRPGPSRNARRGAPSSRPSATIGPALRPRTRRPTEIRGTLRHRRDGVDGGRRGGHACLERRGRSL